MVSMHRSTATRSGTTLSSATRPQYPQNVTIPEKEKKTLPEEPPSISRLTTMRTLANFTVQLVIAILIGQVETSIGIEILNHEIDILVLTTRTHGFQLARCVVAGEHAA
jgi:hypothetical protein